MFKSTFQRFVSCGLALVGLSLAASQAQAGLKIYNPVVIGPVGLRWFASGAMGTARNSLNTTDYIGCSFSVTGAGGTWDGTCGARSGATVVTCKMPSLGFELFMESMRTMTADSAIRFEWNPATGECTKLEVWAVSTQEPKAL